MKRKNKLVVEVAATVVGVIFLVLYIMVFSTQFSVKEEEEEGFNLLILNQTGETMVVGYQDEIFSIQNGDSHTLDLPCKQNESKYYDMTIKLIGKDVHVIDYVRLYVVSDFLGLDSASISDDTTGCTLDTNSRIDILYGGDKKLGSIIYAVYYDKYY